MARPTLDASGRSEQGSSTTCVVTIPTHSSGDIGIILAWSMQGSQNDDLTINESWTAIGVTEAREGGIRDGAGRAFYKELGASETNPTITNDTSTASWICDIGIFSGGTTTGISHAYTSRGKTSTPTGTVTLPDATANNNSIAFRGAGISNDRDGSETLPGGHTLVQDGNDAAGDAAATSCTTDADSPGTGTDNITSCWAGSISNDTEITMTVVLPEDAGAAANPKGPLGMPLHGPLGGPIGA